MIGHKKTAADFPPQQGLWIFCCRKSIHTEVSQMKARTKKLGTRAVAMLLSAVTAFSLFPV
jgi:hypothetical protein